MTLVIVDYENNEVLFNTEAVCVPNIDEPIKVEGEWYEVFKRVLSFKRAGNVCMLFVKKLK